MHPTPLLATAVIAALSAACAVSSPASLARLKPTALHVDASERVTVKAFIRAKSLENKPWYHRRAEDIQIMLPPILADQYVYSAVLVIEDLQENCQGRVIQMGIANPSADQIKVTWDHVLEGGCIKPIPGKSACYEDLKDLPRPHEAEPAS
ncbi:MAG: hypothetical protein JWM80_840 [Cyanobacteria bacterium RYN_339]|nr:hypothetical protein [Cyanobacteria bacterium RYN_339]